MHRAREIAAVLLWAALGGPVFAGADEEAWEWLERMAGAARTANYAGEFIYSHSQGIEAMRIVHAADEAGERELLKSLNGADREIVRNDDEVMCILADKKTVVVGTNFSPRQWTAREPWSQDPMRMAESYDLRLLDVDRVADRPCRVLAVEPKDDLRYGHRLCLDVATGLLLRAETLDLAGGRVENMMFTDLEITDRIAPERLLPTHNHEGFARYVRKPYYDAVDEAARTPSQWRLERLPPGFQQIMVRRPTQDSRGRLIEHRVLSDGFATVSIFFERSDGDRGPHPQVASMGAMSSVSTALGDYRATIIGEVPARTAQAIAESIRPVAAR
jgi:sigma-E factor negative regulatory protein RseB